MDADNLYKPQNRVNFTFHDICIGNNPDGFRQNLPLMGNILPDDA
ncbi:hypothetical protein F0Z19_5007 [Vibrio cyclitrophicus]|nr:hypothetical protein M565_ctg4P570 [Vibrio cyclitrophicus FF75]KAA8596282.1 hypothetical protein F0Z19_5007 [Vibrio cyclitrophicus]